jgi:D-3-phosphoglycerate dehydrogenase
MATRPRILIAESGGFSAEAARRLSAVGDVVMADLDRAGLLASVRDAEILWIRLRHRIDAEVFASAPRLRIIVSPTTGLNHIDIDVARQRGIMVLSLQGEREFLNDVRATAEHTVALMLSLMRSIPQAVDHTRRGLWSRDLFKGFELHQKTVGIVGYGRLGRLVGGYLKAFDCHLVASDPKETPGDIKDGIWMAGLPELLRISDIVSLHVSLTERTRGFFGEEQFAAMKPGAWFVNTARGELVDEAALLRALSSGRLAGAALDVLCDENSGIAQNLLVDYSRTHEHLLITPHIGGCTFESMEKTEVFLAGRLSALLESRVTYETV